MRFYGKLSARVEGNFYFYFLADISVLVYGARILEWS